MKHAKHRAPGGGLLRRVAIGVLPLLALAGCTGKQQPLPNPFTQADRVPPPLFRSQQAGGNPPYYSAPAGGAAPTYSNPLPTTTPYTPAPTSAAPSASRIQVASSGDRIAAPIDSASLRFEHPQQPSSAPPPSTLSQRPALANGWVSGSAPVRTSGVMKGSHPRIRLPGSAEADREPLELAALAEGDPGATGWR